MISIKEKDDLLKQLNILSNTYDLYIVGAGRHGDILGKWMNLKDIDWKGYLDRSKCGEILNGKKIYNTFSEKGENDCFIISSYIYKDAMKSDLVNQGVTDEMILLLENERVLQDIYEDTDNWKKYTEKIKKFCGCHQNKERCFIVGNGPSLKIEDLEMLKNDVTFASNGIYAIYKETDWRPTYYGAYDGVICNEGITQKERIEEIISKCEAAFTSVVGGWFRFKDDKDLQKLHYMRLIRQIDDSTQLPLFSNDCSEVIYASNTITYLFLQLAVYMGFRQIYLLGIDCQYSYERYKGKVTKSSDFGNNMEQIKQEISEMQSRHLNKYGNYGPVEIDAHMAGYMSAKNYGDDHGIKIFNATRGGRLEVFERVDFDKLF